MSELEDKRTFQEKCREITCNWLWWAVFSLARKGGANADSAETKANKAVKGVR